MNVSRTIKGVTCILLSGFLFLCWNITPLAKESIPTVSLTDLLEHPSNYNGKTVCFTGEAIGDILYRGSYAWVNVSDGNNSALGVYMPVKMAHQISVLGAYGRKGDTLQITGTVHTACADHGGDLDLHGSTMKIISVGKSHIPETPTWLIVFCIAGSACALCLCVVVFWRVIRYNKETK